MKLVRDVLSEKSLQELITVDPSEPILEAAEVMTRWNIGALLVMERGELVGLLTERDVVRGVVAAGRAPASTRVADVMTRQVRVVPGDATTEECMGVMTHLRLRHLPVMEDREVVGVVSIGDLVKDVLSDQAFVIEQLELYITRSANA